MKRRRSSYTRSGERGQAIIFLAIVVPVLALIMGLAVEAGRIVVTYRQMQAAADMAAMVGAQDLPNAPSTARSDACTYVQNNGFDSCTVGGTTTNGASKTIVCVPPQSNSPYSFLSYGGNADCSTATTSNYIEVQITDNLGTIPVFNTPISLGVKAVARYGIPGIFDYAIVALDPTATNNQGLFFNPNNGVITNGSMLSNNNTTSSVNQSGSGDIVSCNGRMYATGNETTTPNHLHTYNASTAFPIGFAPPSCNSVTTAGPFTGQDSPVEFFPNAPPIADSYATSQVPSGSTTGNMYASCQLCANDAAHTYYLDRGASPNVWLQASANPPKLSGGSSFLELWPGTYPSISMSNGILVLNPGVYTFTGGSGTDNGVSITGGEVCIYGSPACDEALSRAGVSVTSREPSFTTGAGSGNIPGATVDCGSATFPNGANPGTISPTTWYYWCSPWGTWDSSSHGLTLPTGWSNTTAPQFVDPTTGTTTDSQGNAEPYLNGVTFYMQAASSGSTNKNDFKVAGSVNAGFLAMPNPCVGTGSATTQSVDFPAGAPVSAARSTYLTIVDGTSTSGFNMYPNGDLSSAGDAACRNPGEVWAGEFGAPNGASTPPYSASQHLQFLVFAQNGSKANGDGTAITLTGSSVEQWWGILHTFPPACYYTGESNSNCTNSSSTSYSGPPVSPNNCPHCSVSIGGGNGSAGGPPMLFGQLVADSVSVGGNSTVDVFNRPGGKDIKAGSSLIQ